MKQYAVNSMLFALLLCFALPAGVHAGERSFIVGFKQKPGPSEKALIHGAKGLIKRAYRIIPAMAVTLPEEAVADVMRDPRIAYVEEDGVVTAVDPFAGSEYADLWGVQRIGADRAHASGNIGTGVKIAILDTGINHDHEDLDDNYRGGYDFINDDTDPYDDSWNSHGTHVAGVIAAEQNGTGVIGVAPGAELYAAKVLDDDGVGSIAALIAGLNFSVVHAQVDIVILSLQSPHHQSLQDACDAAYAAGVLLVAEAGDTFGGEVSYPAAYDSVIAVTGTDQEDMRADFSPVGEAVELAAPAVDILSTMSDIAGGRYDYLSGTSQAAAHVAGTAALFLSANPEDVNGDGLVNNEDIRLMLSMTALDLGDPGRDPVYGCGLVNAAAAALPLSFTVTRIPGAPSASAETVSLSGTRYTITINNSGLAKLQCDVSEDGLFRPDLSSTYFFVGHRPQEVTFSLDAATTAFDVTFTPFGRPRAYADILVSVQLMQ